MSFREDLLHLSPEALMQATNAGLVKRALREFAAGYRPALTLDAALTLAAVFPDGVQTTWPSGRPLQEASCSCNATGACRHRVIVALAYRDAARSAAEAPPAPVETVDDAALERVVPETLRLVAATQRAAGLSVELRRAESGEPCETARLPAATVRFWAGAAIEAARCDCARAAACEHVVLGVWAFRAAAASGFRAAVQTVRLGDARAPAGPKREPFDALVAALLRDGVSRGVAALSQPLSRARAAAGDAAWLTLLLADLERWSEAYAQRSALYDPAQGVDLLAELALRLAGATRPDAARNVLGSGLAGETPLDRLRLIGLGARTVRDGERRRTTLALADADTGTGLVLTHDWAVADALRAKEPMLRGAERIAKGVLLEALAQGQLLARHAARRPDGSVRLSGARSADNSVMAQNADWSLLGAPLRFERCAALVHERRAHPHEALRPRHAVGRFVVFSPARIGEVSYDPDEQAVLGVLVDADEAPLLIERRHERHAPHALDALAAALLGRCGPVRHVAGMLRWRGGLACIEPWALACDRIVVPDVAAAQDALPDLPLGSAPEPGADPGSRALAALRECLGRLLHHGSTMLPRGWTNDAALLARRLADAGFAALAARLVVLAGAVAQAQANPAGVALAVPLLDLLALRQLHEDAAVLASLADRDAASSVEHPSPLDA